jgi:hypothetical protein
VAPSAASASARFTAVVDLPTPPLPLATAMMFLTPGISLTPFCTAWVTTLENTLALMLPMPGRAFSAPITAARMPSIWLFAG